MIRCLVCVMLLSSASAAYALDPMLILLLRMMRDQAISSSIQAGIGSLRQESPPQPPQAGVGSLRQKSPSQLPGLLFAPPSPSGTEDERLRALIDESFLHLSAAQRDAVYESMQKILNDPQNAQVRPQIVAAFTSKARAAREGYSILDRLSYAEKRTLAAQAKEEFRNLPAGQRQQMLEVLQSGMLPVPRDFNDIMLAEFNTIPSVAGNEFQRE